MAGPWEKYAAPAAPADAEGPWTKYATRAAPADAEGPSSKYAPPAAPEAPDGEPNVPLASVPGQALVNLPASAAKLAGDLYTAVTSPVQTAKGLADIAAGAVRAGAQKVLPEAVFSYIDQLDNPETTKRISEAANAAGSLYAGKYGSYERIKHTMATDPVGFLADVSTLLTGGAMATGRVAPGVSNVMARAATTTDPLVQAVRAGVGGVNAMRTAARQVGDVAAVMPGAVRALVDPNTIVVNRLLQGGQDPAEMAAALRATQNLPVTPGAPAPTLSARLIEAGAPSLQTAALERGMAQSSPEVAQTFIARQQQTVSAIQEQLARVEAQIQAQAASMTPADLSQLRQVRDSLLRNLAAEQQTLGTAGRAVAEQLPTVRQAEVGGAIQERARTGLKELKATQVRPAFEKAFEAAPGPSIDLSGALSTARELVGDIGTLVDPSRVSSGVRNLLRVEPPAAAGEVPAPPVVSLQDFQSIRSSLLKQSRAVRETDPTRAMNIDRVVREMDAAFESASIPQAARTQYEAARRLVSDVQVPKYGTGETAMALGRGPRNMPSRLPSQQVEGFLKTEESAAQFARTFKDDPATVQTMQQGVLDLYRQDVVNPVTGLVDPRKAATFESKYARQLDTLEASGVSVRDTLGQVRQDATKAQNALDALASETKKFKGAKDAEGVVDLALKSPMDMQFVRDRLSPAAREALGGELTARATSLIERGDPAAALKYLKQNEKTLKIGLGKRGAQTYDELVRVAGLQDELSKISGQVPKTDIITPVKLSRDYTAAELTDLQVVVDDLKRMRQVEELGTPPDVAAKRLGTEQAQAIGARPQDWPAYFNPIYTSFKNVASRALERLDKRSVAAFMDLAIKDPDKLIPMLEAAAAKKTAAAARGPLRPLTAPTVRGAPLAAAGALQNKMSEQENQNAMRR